jgi:hypothetical protein
MVPEGGWNMLCTMAEKLRMDKASNHGKLYHNATEESIGSSNPSNNTIAEKKIAQKLCRRGLGVGSLAAGTCG